MNCTGMKHIETILFDWDGTLVDSVDSAFLTFKKSLEHFDVPFTWAQFDEHYTPDWYRMYEAVGLSADRWKLADAMWKEFYPREPYTLVEGAHATLMELRQRGYRLGIVTSGSHWRLVPEIKEFGLEGMFATLICNEHVSQRKPHPEGLLKASAELKCDSATCSYVGDVPEDIFAGKGAQMHTVGVLSRYPTSKRLPESQPDISINKISDLLEHFPAR